MRTKAEYGTRRERGSREREPTARGYSIEEVIEKIGFGRFHLRICMVTSLANIHVQFEYQSNWFKAKIADSMEINILGILSPVLQCEWSLTDLQIALYSSIIFISVVIFSPFVAELSDRYGRRRILLLVLLIGTYFGLLSGFAPTYTWLLVLRFFVGCMMTSACLAIVYLAEFMPKKHRGKTLTLANMTCFSTGSMLEVLLAYAILGRLGFRVWIAASAIPLAIAALITYFSPNTPRFNLVSGNTAEAQETLEEMARVNHGTLPEGTLVSNIPVSNTMPFKERIALLFSEEYRKTTVLLLIYGFMIMFAFYGTLISSAELLSRTGSGSILSEADDADAGIQYACSMNCEDAVTSSLGDLAIIAFAEFIGSIVGSFLVDKTGRKFLMIYPTVILGLLELLLIFIKDSRPLLISVLFIIRFVALTPSAMPYTYCAEVYPTSFRTTGEATTFVSERIGAALSPFVAQILLRTNPTLALCVFASVAFIAATVAVFLPVETKNVELKDT